MRATSLIWSRTRRGSNTSPWFFTSTQRFLHAALSTTMNTSTSQPPPLAERSDVHKSCKSLEVVVNLLNDYCEAAGAVVQLQKKLAKAIRDIAHLKSTPDIAGALFPVIWLSIFSTYEYMSRQHFRCMRTNT
jgi:hypothetical protein